LPRLREASKNFFNSVETFPAPLIHTNDYGDNGDFLDLLGDGEIVMSSGSGAGDNLMAITNKGSTYVLGFLLSKAFRSLERRLSQGQVRRRLS